MLRRPLFTICLLIMGMWILGACTSEGPIPLSNAVEEPTSYNAIPAGQFAVTGCQTYIGAHPLYPGELFCCSAPSTGSAPVCAPGDTPDIPCVTEFEFCDDGTAMKALSPDPKTGFPGHTISTSGSWTVDPDTGELEVITTSSAMDGSLITVTTETYPCAFTYDNGTKLDLYSAAAVTIDAAGIGSYHLDYSLFVFDHISNSCLWNTCCHLDKTILFQISFPYH